MNIGQKIDKIVNNNCFLALLNFSFENFAASHLPIYKKNSSLIFKKERNLYVSLCSLTWNVFITYTSHKSI